MTSLSAFNYKSLLNKESYYSDARKDLQKINVYTFILGILL